ncbi:hypothetical protein [Pediococcus acidilactici]|uniref:hypothetical protein n=1 Tax=Pediococcus acidilactici TaxID=1254 RepID=UPI00132F9910|nr:hypothetical protein [Pediococcus acidilactici]KAF0361403.1 hypothetical protein GBO49_00655 [Pediococcus acidilactici]KAF0531491.1 hypothetical protein GBP35_01345 [Pediococcus acidilactici]
MTITKAKQLYSPLGMQQCYELCNDWLDEQDILFAVKNKIIPELTFQAISKDVIPAWAVKQKINSMPTVMIG